MIRILLCSHWFSPSFGGVETVSRILAEEFSGAGANVTVITETPGPYIKANYKVCRKPSLKAIKLLADRCDIILQNMISLRTLGALALSRKPIVVTHQSWMRRPDGTRGIENYVKLLAVRFCHNVAISNAIAQSIPAKSVVIGNPFECAEFRNFTNIPRDKDIVFMGRLIPEKGCDLLLKALAKLRDKGLTLSLSVIGDGPEMSSLRSLAAGLELDRQVQFLGKLTEGRGQFVARHKVMAIPSVWHEPFGVVALEGIASGCAIVASSSGGLPDAVGPCGIYFSNGDTDGLADALENVIVNPLLLKQFVLEGENHLRAFQPSVIANRYLKMFESLTRQR